MSWLNRLRQRSAAALSHQSLIEYYHVATNRLRPGIPREDARLDIELFLTWTVVAPDARLYAIAIQTQDRYRFSWWDSLIVAAALRGGCTHLISEDMQHGQTLDGLKIISPFVVGPDDVLAH